MVKKYIKVLISLCLMCAVSIGICNNSMSVFYTIVADDINVYRGSYTLTQSIYVLTMSAFSSILIKRINEKNFKLCLYTAYGVCVVCFILMGLSSHLWQFYLLSFIRGLSCGMFQLVVISTIVGGWFKSKRGLVSSIILAVGGLVGVFFAPMYSWFIKMVGWRYGYMLVGLSAIVLLIPTLFIPISLHPSYLNEVPFSDGSADEKKVHNQESFNKKSYYAIIIFSFCVSFLPALINSLPGYTTSIGLSYDLGVALTSVGMASNLVFKLVFGIIIDKLNAFKANLINVAMVFISIIGLLIFSSVYSLYLNVFIFAGIYSATSIGLQLISRELFGDNNYDKTFPAIQLASNTSVAISLPCINYIYDFTGSYRPAIYIFLIISIFSFLLMLYANKKAKEI